MLAKMMVGSWARMSAKMRVVKKGLKWVMSKAG